MRSYYPKSFLKLIVTGFVLVSLPLIASYVSAAIYLSKLADHSQRAVYQAVLATQASRMLLEQITTMERNARQFLVLDDKSLFEGYEKMHLKFEDTAKRLSGLQLDELQRNLLTELSNTERNTFETLRLNPHDSEISSKSAQIFPVMIDIAQQILTGSSRLIDRQVDVLQAMAEKAQNIMMLQALAVIPFALLLSGGFTYLIARPIAQIDAAIRRLGDGEFTLPVSVKGPEDIQRLGHRLDWLRVRLVNVEAQKNKLLRHISHELKTPLTSVREGSELLADEVVGRLNPQQSEIVGILQQSAVQLQKRIEDLLSFSIALSRDSALNLESVELDKLILKVEANQKLAIMTKELKIENNVFPLSYSGDEEKLMILIDNLLSNAVKYSPRGGTIQVTLNQEKNQVVLDMVDQGPGIPPSDYTKVFDAFFQGEQRQEAHVMGTGLGLSIAKEYAIAHHGTIDVVANADCGAHFCLKLPLNLAEQT